MFFSLFQVALLIIVVLTTSSRQSNIKQTTKNENLEICEQPVDALPCNVLLAVVKKDGLFSITKETLNNDCPKILDSFRCLKDHWESCRPLSALNLLTYMSGVKDVMEELCDPASGLRIDYEKQALCLSESSRALMNCTFKAERKADSHWRNSHRRYRLNASAYRCLAHIELVSCVRNVASQLCSAEAGLLLGRLVERSVRPYRLLNCHNSNNLNRPSNKKEYQRLLF